MPYIYRIGLQGYRNKDRTTLAFDIGSPADHAAALNAANQIRGALVDITKAFVRFEYLTDVVSEDNQLPTDPSADTYEEAAVVVHTGATGAAEKLHVLRIPAPIEALFVGQGTNVDATNALLQQYVQQISQHAFVSDGEVVNTAIDNGGIKEGYLRSRPRNYK